MSAAAPPSVPRQSMQVDIVGVGFGPAMGGFLTRLTRRLAAEADRPFAQSRAVPGMPLQVICYERADDVGFGVSGLVTRARGIRADFPDLQPDAIPMAAPVRAEKLVYLLDPLGASRRPALLRLTDGALRLARRATAAAPHALELPWIPPFLAKHDGLVMALGQFNQWVAQQIMAGGLAQIWPGMPVAEPLIEGRRVVGVRLADQGVDRRGRPEAGYMPGMDIRAELTVVADGPVGAVGRRLDEIFGLPPGHHRREWAVGMKAVVELPPACALEPGTVIHTFGYPEPEIFGFLYVHPGGLASLGIFVPSWFANPVRTSYRYLQHWMQHPYLWRHLDGGALRSWGAKSLLESGRRGEPHLAGDGWARIGEGSGTTNVLTGSGVDEAWTSGAMLADAVIELLKADKPFAAEFLEATYVARRRSGWLAEESRMAEHARDGFGTGFLAGMLGMGLAGLSRGRLWWPGRSVPPHERLLPPERWFRGRIPRAEIDRIRRECLAQGVAMHDAFMDRAGWPRPALDGRLLVSHQDALLLGGKVQAPPGFADHVAFLYPYLCEQCGPQLCVEMCSAQAIAPSPGGGVPQFDREKCVHCGACLWNCARAREDDPERGNIVFGAGAGGLHSAEN